MYKHFFKRVIDFTISLIALLLIWPVLAVVALWLHFANKGAGAFFFQERHGLHGKIFKVIKFKTIKSVHFKTICRICQGWEHLIYAE